MNKIFYESKGNACLTACPALKPASPSGPIIKIGDCLCQDCPNNSETTSEFVKCTENLTLKPNTEHGSRIGLFWTKSE